MLGLFAMEDYMIEINLCSLNMNKTLFIGDLVGSVLLLSLSIIAEKGQALYSFSFFNNLMK